MRQKYEAAVSVRPVDTLQPDAVGVGVGRRLFPCIAFDERYVDGLACDGLDRFSQRGDRHACRFVGGRDNHGQHLNQRINRHVAVLSVRRCCPSSPERAPRSEVDGIVRAAPMRALRCTRQRALIMDERRADPGLQ